MNAIPENKSVSELTSSTNKYVNNTFILSASYCIDINQFLVNLIFLNLIVQFISHCTKSFNWVFKTEINLQVQ